MNNLLILPLLLFMDFGGKSSFDFTTKHCFSLKSHAHAFSFNRVFNIEKQTSHQEIEEIKNYYGSTPFMWVVDENDFSSAQMLEVNGFTYKYKLPAMTLNLDDIKNMNYQNGIIVKNVCSHEDMKTWKRLVHETKDFSDQDIQLFVDHIQSKSAESIKYYIGYYFEKPVGICMVIEHQNCVSLHFLGTLLEYRRNGIGFALTHHALIQAKERGFKQALLLSSDMAKSLYLKLGFVEFGSVKIYGN